jgi:DNA-directed RNA polymerase subunit K/omega
MLTRYEVARLVGLRALQISEGSEPRVFVTDERLRRDDVYVAALELYEKKMDACVVRGGNSTHVSMLNKPLDLVTMLNTRDGGDRVYCSSGAVTARTSSV